MNAEHIAEGDATAYCGAEYGEVRDGECECPHCAAKPFPDPLQDGPMPGYLKAETYRACAGCDGVGDSCRAVGCPASTRATSPA